MINKTAEYISIKLYIKYCVLQESCYENK